jgi:hypothetical protein
MLEPPHCLHPLLCGCARRCLVHCIACTVSRVSDARTCLIPRIANIGFFGRCVGTLCAFSSQLRRLPYYRPLLLHGRFWPSLPSSDEGRFLISTASSLPLSSKLACLCLASFFLLFSSLSRPAPPPCPRSPCPVPSPPASHASRNGRFSPGPLSRFHARPCPQAELSKDQP